MKTKKKKVEMKGEDSLRTISLFLKWYLSLEVLANNEGVQKLLEGSNFSGGRKEDAWLEDVRKALLPEAIRHSGEILERPLTAVELMFIDDKVEEFLWLYRLSRTGQLEGWDGNGMWKYAEPDLPRRPAREP